MEDKFRDIDTSNTDLRAKHKKKTEKEKKATTKPGKLPSINFYPENWRVRKLVERIFFF